MPSDVQSYQPKTKVIVHYKPAEGDAVADRGVYMWGTDKNGATLNGAWHAFTGEDSYGKVFETTIDGAYDAAKIGVIVTTEGWDKVGSDRTIDGSTGKIYDGAIPTVDASIGGEFGRVMGWADQYRRLKVRTNADTPTTPPRPGSSALRASACAGPSTCSLTQTAFPPSAE